MDSNNETSTLSIVIPVYNSKDTIEELVNELVSRIPGSNSLEIVLVNDDSKDNSEEICIELHKKFKDIVSFISLSRNVGEHNAVMAGLNHTTGDFVVIMDDDFQNPISEVIKMVDFIKQSNYDVVYSYYEKKKHSLPELGEQFQQQCCQHYA